MRVRPAVALLVLAGTYLLPRAGCAQDADSVLFHKGQWGAEFNIGSGFFAAGVLLFTSSKRALLLDLGTDYRYSSSTYNGFEVSDDDLTVVARLGMHAYRPYGARLYRLLTVGVLLNYTSRTFTQDTLRATSEGLGGGVFADIGATWLITPHLGLGAKFGATVTYTHGTVGGAAGSGSQDRFAASLGRAALVGQLYF